jgi:nitrite reductase/ring-hydroxylating ferredoxin subunit
MSVPARVDLCGVEELRAAKRLTRWVEELRDELTALFLDDGIRVLSTVCPHFGGELDGDGSSGELRCRWHGLRFDARTGSCRETRFKASLRRYEFALESGRVVVTIPDAMR